MKAPITVDTLVFRELSMRVRMQLWIWVNVQAEPIHQPPSLTNCLWINSESEQAEVTNPW